jgi:hypothetical protein
MPVMPRIEISIADKKISTDFWLGDKGRAEYVSDHFGCRLVNP